MYIGYYGKDTPNAAFESLLLLAFAAFGYHIYSLMLLLNTTTGGKFSP
jgi:hypothetical protein